MQQVGEYRIQRELGRGATAQVFEGVNPSSGARAAIKVFFPGTLDQKDLKRRAQAEFRAISGFDHPQIVRMIEAFWDLEPPSVVMQLIDGVSLEQFQSQLPYILPEVSLLIIRDVLSALEYAHERGVIHRDIKPANILIDRNGRAVVTDFGLAKVTDMTSLTMTGTILGSPDFMSPEQARGDVVMASSDLFSVGSLLYYLVTGTRPFTRHSPLATLSAVSDVRYEPAHQRNPKIGPEIGALIQRAIAKDPRDRFGSAREFLNAIDSYLLSIGLPVDHFQMQDFVLDPTAFVRQALKAKAEALVSLTQKAIQARKLDQAMIYVSHLSLVAPEAESVSQMLVAIQEAKQKKRPVWIYWSSGAALLALVGATLLIWAQKKSSESTGVAVASSTQPLSLPTVAIESSPVPEASQATPTGVVNPPPAISAATPEKPKALPKTETAMDERPPRPAKPVTPVVKKTTNTVRFDVAPGIKVYWNGKEVDMSRPFPDQKFGTYSLRLEMPGMNPIEQQVQVRPEEPTEIRVR